MHNCVAASAVEAGESNFEAYADSHRNFKHEEKCRVLALQDGLRMQECSVANKGGAAQDNLLNRFANSAGPGTLEKGCRAVFYIFSAHPCVRSCVHVRVCTCAGMYVCMYACFYECMCVYVHMCLCPNGHFERFAGFWEFMGPSRDS